MSAPVIPPRRSQNRKGFTYAGVMFSEDGRTAWMEGIEYREMPFPAERKRPFNIFVLLAVLLTFPGIPLLAWLGFQKFFLLGALVLLPLLFWFNRYIHRCARCGTASRKVSTPYDNAPVLFFCGRCRVFFEHGHIDGGFPR